MGEALNVWVDTSDRDLTFALWAWAQNEGAPDSSDLTIEEALRKSDSLKAAHEVWILVNDGLTSAALIAGLLKVLHSFVDKDKSGTKLKLRCSASISLETKEKFRKLGCEIEFEKDSTS